MLLEVSSRESKLFRPEIFYGALESRLHCLDADRKHGKQDGNKSSYREHPPVQIDPVSKTLQSSQRNIVQGLLPEANIGLKNES
jgi:hypothetical protein